MGDAAVTSMVEQESRKLSPTRVLAVTVKTSTANPAKAVKPIKAQSKRPSEGKRP